MSKAKFKEKYKGKLDELGIIKISGTEIEERERSRSRSKSKEKRKESQKAEDPLVKKWVMSSSNMTSEDQNKFLRLMGVRPKQQKEQISDGLDLVEASKSVNKFEKQNNDLERQFYESRKMRYRGKRGLGV